MDFSGYVTLSSGIVIQFGLIPAVYTGDRTYTKTFPISFNAKCLSVISANLYNNDDPGGWAGYTKKEATKSSFTVYQWNSCAIYWIAVGN